MGHLTINEAITQYKKSRTTIKKAIALAPAREIKNGGKLNTGLYKKLISISYLDSYFGNQSQPTDNTTDKGNSELVETLKTQLKNQQTTIEKLLHNQEQFLERQREQNILTERSNQRIALLTQHFQKNKKIHASQEKQEEIIEEIIEEEKIVSGSVIDTDDKIYLPNDRKSWNDWLQSFNDAK